ncbi:MAG: hypothetical protein HFE85_03365 [Clostridiales bacterium]|nr:hypothetical protein [Clostridiales bacterium]
MKPIRKSCEFHLNLLTVLMLNIQLLLPFLTMLGLHYWFDWPLWPFWIILGILLCGIFIMILCSKSASDSSWVLKSQRKNRNAHSARKRRHRGSKNFVLQKERNSPPVLKSDDFERAFRIDECYRNFYNKDIEKISLIVCILAG